MNFTNNQNYFPSLISDDVINKKYFTLLKSFLLYSKLKNNNKTDFTLNTDLDQLDPVFDVKFPSASTIETLDLNSPVIIVFTNDLRVSVSDPFDRNILEILLYPLSKDILVQKKILNLKNEETFLHVKKLVQNKEMRHFIQEFSTLVLNDDLYLNKFTTLEKFKKISFMEEVLRKLNPKTPEALSLNEKYTLLGVTLQALMLEVIVNFDTTKRKMTIFNFLVNKLNSSHVV